MEPLPLPFFLLILCGAVIAAAATVWFVTQSGLSLATVTLWALLAAGIVRLLKRVE